MAYLWDMRKDDFSDFRSVEIPHIKDRPKDEVDNQETDVSSIHWNKAGDKLVTSSADFVARVWKVDAEGGVEIYRVKNFNQVLLTSKFCDENDKLVATGGFMSKVCVWDCSTPEGREVAVFDFSTIDPELQGLEIEW